MDAKKIAPHHPKAMESAATKPHFASTTQQVNRLALACTTGVSCGKISPKAKAPALQNVLGIAVATPTDKRGFVMSEFLGHGVAVPAWFTGMAGAIRKDARMAIPMF